MNHESFFDPEAPSALSALAAEHGLRKKEFDPYLAEIELSLEETTLDQIDREWLGFDYARMSFTRMAYELSYTCRLLELIHTDADKQDFEQVDELLDGAVRVVLEARIDMRQAGVDVNGILDEYNLTQYKIIE